MNINKKKLPGSIQFPLILIMAFLILLPTRITNTGTYTSNFHSVGGIRPDGNTNVKLVEETVFINVVPIGDITSSELALQAVEAEVEISYLLRNEGTQKEALAIQFPLANPMTWNGDGSSLLLERVQISVEGASIASERIELPNPQGEDFDPVPWLQFDSEFPVEQDVRIDIKYLQKPTGSVPMATFSYAFNTKIGWSDKVEKTILTMKLPYEANEYNVISWVGSQDVANFGFSGDEVSWIWVEYDPDDIDDFQATILVPQVWQELIDAQEQARMNPWDSQNWNMLGKAYDICAIGSDQRVRADAPGKRLFTLAEEAYNKSLRLDPENAEFQLDLIEHWMLALPVFTADTDDPYIQLIYNRLLTFIHKHPDNVRAQDLLDQFFHILPEGVNLQSPTPLPTFTPTVTRTHLPTKTGTPTQVITPSLEVTSEKQPVQYPVQCLKVMGGLIFVIMVIKRRAYFQ